MSAELENLVKIGRIFPFTPAPKPLEELRASGRAKLKDAAKQDLSRPSQFDLAYGGTFALSLAALHATGHKPQDRIDAINTLTHTTTLAIGHRRVILRAHTLRNQAEYEGERVDDAQLVTDLIAAGNALAALLPSP